MDKREQISKLLGRPIEITPINFKGQKGFLPLYFNHAAQNSASVFFAPTEEECLTRFLEYLQKNGEQNATDIDGERRPSAKD